MLILGTIKKENVVKFAKHFKVSWKSSFKRLNELDNLNLVRRQEDGRWIKIQNSKNILTI